MLASFEAKSQVFSKKISKPVSMEAIDMADVPDIHQRVRILIRALGPSGISFATQIGVNPSQINNVVGGRLSTLGWETAEKIKATFPEVDGNWLLTGLGEPFLPGRGEVGDSGNVSNVTGNFNVTQVGNKHRIKQTLGSTQHPSVQDARLTQCEADKKALEARVESLESLMAAKDVVIATKDELIAALRGK